MRYIKGSVDAKKEFNKYILYIRSILNMGLVKNNDTVRLNSGSVCCVHIYQIVLECYSLPLPLAGTKPAAKDYLTL